MEFLSDLKSDYNRISHLLDTEKITDIEFTDQDSNITIGNANDNDNQIPDETNMNDSAMNDLSMNQNMTGGDNYSKIQEEGNRRAERLSDTRPEEYDVDEMRNDGSRRNRSIGYDFQSARGGKKDENNLDSYEKEFFAIFNKAKEYRRRIMDVQNRMEGGQMNEESGQSRESEGSSGEKKPRPLNETMRLTIDVARKLKESEKCPGIQWKHLMQVSKLIIDDAKSGGKEVNIDVRNKALELASNPDEYVSKWRLQTAQKNQGSQGSQGSNGSRSVRQESTRQRRSSGWLH